MGFSFFTLMCKGSIEKKNPQLKAKTGGKEEAEHHMNLGTILCLFRDELRAYNSIFDVGSILHAMLSD